MSPILLRWSLNQSEGGALKIAQGLIKAASSDNVQAGALMACESFGMTLPICTATRLKMERLAKRANPSHVLRFIKATVGYIAGDCTDFLSNNEGGVRFLSLAAALSTLDLFEAAQVLVCLLESTAKKGEPIKPTVFQIKDLLQALKSKLDLADFATSVAGWEIYCSFEDPEADDKSRGSIMQAEVPPKDSIKRLVHALSTCSRIGEACYVRIIANRIHFPWTIAFVKWFLGDPPEIQTREGDGDLGLYLPSPTSRVFLEETDYYARDEFIISVERQVPHFQTFIEGTDPRVALDRQFGSSGKWLGLVEVRTWVRLRVAHVSGFQMGAATLTRRAVLTLAKDLLEELKVVSAHRRELENDHPLEKKWSGLVEPCPFPDMTALRPFINSLFDICDDCMTSSNWTELYPLMPKEDLSSICLAGSITNWGSKSQRVANPNIDPRWMKDIALLTADILCLSLYGLDVESPFFPKVAQREPRWAPAPGAFLWDWDNRADQCIATVREWIERPQNKPKMEDSFLPFERQHLAEFPDIAIARLYQLLYPKRLSNNGIVKCGLRSIHRHALRKLGALPEADNAIIASTASQVIYPAIYETQTLTSWGYLQLNCVPGQLLWEGMAFRHAVSDGLSTEAGSNGVHPYRAAPISAPPWCLPLGKRLLESAIQPSNVSWRVTIGDQVLKVGFRLSFADSDTDVYVMDPWWILDAVSFCRMTPSCNHSLNSKLPDMDEVAQIINLSRRPFNLGRQVYWLDVPGSPTHKIEGYVYPTHGREQDRVALATRLLGAHGGLMVVHEEGCMECALRASVDSKIGLLIC
ncbi:MAG: hypothetical protein M1812_003209 [Candelaria pacifica]|nr:MAG: hypothetical protein M1812_003209 [Candelaria pacifica]